MDKPILMGRKTYESLGKPLPGRLNIIISQQQLVLPEGVLVFNTIEEGIQRMEAENTDEGCIIGGGKIFEQTMNDINRIYMTRVHATIEGASAFFPVIDHTHWKLGWEENNEADEKHKFPFTFQQYERITL